MEKEKISELNLGFQTAYIDGDIVSSIDYRPTFISNDYSKGKKVISSIEEELLKCKKFKISVAFITLSGLTPLLETLKELEIKQIPGEVLTTNYLSFSEPDALDKINSLNNVELKIYDSDKSQDGFHTKGYIFEHDEIYHIIVGSSNVTLNALTKNKEWNAKIISTKDGEIGRQVLDEFNTLWESKFSKKYSEIKDNYREKYNITKAQREIARKEDIVSIESISFKPNAMQVGFVSGLKNILNSNNNRALLISATGTGKTFASAFAIQQLGYKKVLFLIHREQLAKQTKEKYEFLFHSSVSMGLVGGGKDEYDKDFIFATVQTMSKRDNLKRYNPYTFDCIIVDEAHHITAKTYQDVINYFHPKLLLGMTATPDKRDDNVDNQKNIYELFDYQIAYEIRLKQAMEEDLLCPFHYFGINDVSACKEIEKNEKNITFDNLTSDERVKHIIEQSNYYGFSGNRVKGLIFCSRIDESNELSKKFNKIINPKTGKYFRTVSLSGKTPEKEREIAFSRLAMEERDSTGEMQPLDYIFSVEILNEGVDIVEVNQVIMLRPTESPIVFIQQLGRGLRKARGKEYVVILDFIGNYQNNFFIPIALYGDRTYNKDTIRKYVISGNYIIPGSSTVHFDSISRERIFHSIDRINSLKSIIKNSYQDLKERIGRIPYLIDFYNNNEVDPLVIIKEYKTYQDFIIAMGEISKEKCINEDEKLTLEYLSNTILCGLRPYELELLKSLINRKSIEAKEFKNRIACKYSPMSNLQFDSMVNLLHGKFTKNSNESLKYSSIDLIENDPSGYLKRLQSFNTKLDNEEFKNQLVDLINVGLEKYKEKNETVLNTDIPFILYEKYSRKDICFLMNEDHDLSSTMYGKWRKGNDVFLFVTYQKQNGISGKPNYADSFVNNEVFNWDSQINNGPDSKYMKDVVEATQRHLFIKKSDYESKFYYMGTFDIIDIKEAFKENEKGLLKPIAKVEMRMHYPVRDDILAYLTSNFNEMEIK